MLKNICRFLAACLALLFLGPIAASAAGSVGGQPRIVITMPANGAQVHGSSITVHVAVHDFALATPVPVARLGQSKQPSPADTGHIQYVLDSQANFKATRDASATQTHSWKNVPPGPHTVTAYLANSQYVRIPSVKPARISVDVVAPAHPMGHPQSKKPSVSQSHPTNISPAAGSGSEPGISGAPTTGGAATIVTHPSLNVSLLLAAALLMVLGALFFISRRVLFASATATAGAASSQPTSPSVSPNPPVASFATESSGQGAAATSQPGGSPEQRDSNWGTFSAAREDSDTPDAPQPSSYPPHAEPPDPTTQEPSPAPPDAIASYAQTNEISPPRIAFSNGAQDAGATNTPDSGLGLGDAALRSRAAELSREWISLVDALVKRLERQEAERRALLAKISTLEQSAKSNDSIREVIAASDTGLSPQELQKATEVARALAQDPGHIVTLSQVSQNAEVFQRIVRAYVSMQKAIQEREPTSS